MVHKVSHDRPLTTDEKRIVAYLCVGNSGEDLVRMMLDGTFDRERILREIDEIEAEAQNDDDPVGLDYCAWYDEEGNDQRNRPAWSE